MGVLLTAVAAVRAFLGLGPGEPLGAIVRDRAGGEKQRKTVCLSLGGGGRFAVTVWGGYARVWLGVGWAWPGG